MSHAVDTHVPAARVAVVDLDMPLTSMAWFMVTLAIASVPAMLILMFVAGLFNGFRGV